MTQICLAALPGVDEVYRNDCVVITGATNFATFIFAGFVRAAGKPSQLETVITENELSAGPGSGQQE